MTTPAIRLWYAIAAIVISCIVVAGVSVQYANYVDKRSSQRWCSLIGTLDDAYHATPPQTPAGRNVASDIARLRGDLGCGVSTVKPAPTTKPTAPPRTSSPTGEPTGN